MKVKQNDATESLKKGANTQMESRANNEGSIIAVRVKAGLRNVIVALSEKHEVSASVIVRQALKLGLKKLDREVFRSSPK